MRSVAVVLLLSVLAGCADPVAPKGYGVDVTVASAALTETQRNSVASVHLGVSGDETYSQDIAIADKLHDGDVRFRYVPGVKSGTLVFSLVCESSAGAPVAGASSGPVKLVQGKAVSLTLTLAASGPSGGDDMGAGADDGGANDMLMPPDMTTLPQGTACKSSSECVTGVCSDGYCCDTACDGVCQACNLPGALGTCTSVVAGGSPSHGSCAATAAATCGHDGTCDGKGACSLWPLNTVCAASTCDSASNSYTPAKVCDGKGVCQPSNAISCAPFTCADAAQCKSTCTQNSDCSSSNVCNGGSCGLKGPGQQCSGNAECGSGFCVDGVCCNAACGAKCQSCNLPGTVGTCTTVPAGQDPRSMCAASAGNDAHCTPGGCSGSGADSCLTAAAGTPCGGSCTGGAPIDAACDAAGKCSVSSQGNACPVCQTCTAGATSASCTAVADGTQCAAGYCGNINTAYAPAYCSGGACPAHTAATSCGEYTCFGAGVCNIGCGTCGSSCSLLHNCTGPINSDCVSGSCAGACSCAGVSGICSGNISCM